MKKNVFYYESYSFNSIKKGEGSYGATDKENVYSKNNSQKYEYFNRHNAIDDQDIGLPSFLFFKPDFFLSKENKWKLVENETKQEFNLDCENVVEVNRFLKKDINFQFDVCISWDQYVVCCKSFDIKIEEIDLVRFKRDLESFKFSNNFCIDANIENIQDFFVIEGNLLKKNSTFDFKGKVVFSHEVHHCERLSFLFKKVEYPKKIIRKKVLIRLPSKSVLDIWNKEVTYFKNNVVYYKENFFICLVDDVCGMLPTLDSNYWRIYEDFGDSFLKSDEGQKSISYFKNSLNFFVEKHLGDEITFRLVHPKYIPNLNDFFFFEKKRYRVVSFVKNIINGRPVFIIKGIEILKIGNYDLSLDRFKGNGFNYEISLEKLKEADFISLIYPTNEKLEVDSSFIVNVEEFF